MKLPHGVRRWFELSNGASEVRRRIEDELEFHIESRTEELMRQGLPRVAAHAQAVQEFGDMVQARDELGAIDVRGVERRRRAEWWGGLGQDLKFAWRGVRRQPAFALLIAVTLGLGLGVNVTTFEMVDRLLFRAPAHVTDPDRVQRVYYRETSDRPGLVGPAGTVAQPTTTYPDFAALRANSRTMDIAAFSGTKGTVGRGAEAQKIMFGVASADFFRILGVRPHLGRFYTNREDGSPHGEALAVLDYGYWQRRFGGDRNALGQSLLIGKKLFTVVGVAPPGFTGIDLKQMDVWLPVSVIAEEWVGTDWTTSRSMGWLRLVGRLRGEATREQAEAELTALWRPLSPQRGRDSTAAVVLGPVQQARGPQESAEKRSGMVAGWLAGVSLLVLLVACANVANLLLTRAIRQRRETGVRLALGVGRIRLLRQFLVESLLLCTIGATAAFLLSRWGGGLLRSLLFSEITWTSTTGTYRLVIFLLLAVLFTTFAIVAVPAYQMLRESIIPALKAGPREGHARSQLRTALLFVQATLSVVLLIGAGLFVRSFYNASTMNLGFDARRVIVADLDLTVLDWDRARRQEFYVRARDRIARLRGVSSAAVGTSVPFWSAMMPDVSAEGHDTIRIAGVGGPFNVNVTPDYFTTMGMRILNGRAFTAADREGAPKVAIVDQTMARLLWPGQNPLGKCLYVRERSEKPPCSAIIGVAADSRRMHVSEGPVMHFYVPFAQRGVGMLTLMVRTHEDPAAVMPSIQRELQTLAPGLPYADVRLLQDLVDPQIHAWKLGAALFSVFGLLALLLAAVGLYSMLSHSVASRTREVGVRMALGARASDVVRMIVRDGMSVAVAGVATGIVVAFFASQRIAPLLFQVTGRDPLSYAVAGTVLLVVAFIAVLVPARRATGVDPASALKAE